MTQFSMYTYKDNIKRWRFKDFNYDDMQKGGNINWMLETRSQIRLTTPPAERDQESTEDHYKKNVIIIASTKKTAQIISNKIARKFWAEKRTKKDVLAQSIDFGYYIEQTLRTQRTQFEDKESRSVILNNHYKSCKV